MFWFNTFKRRYSVLILKFAEEWILCGAASESQTGHHDHNYFFHIEFFLQMYVFLLNFEMSAINCRQTTVNSQRSLVNSLAVVYDIFSVFL